MSGSFCAGCGAPAQGIESDAAQDAPTRMVAGVDEQLTSQRPQPAGRPDDVETGWYQSADASSAGEAPYAGGDDSALYQSHSTYGQGAGYGATVYPSAGHQAALQPSRSNNTPFIAAGLVSLLVLASLGGYLVMRGGGDSSKTAQTPTAPPNSPAPTTTPTTTSTAAPTTQPTTAAAPAPVRTATATVTTTRTTVAAPTSSPSQGDSGGDVRDLPHFHQGVTMGDTAYAVTMDGLSVGIYEASSSGPKKLADITLGDKPYFKQRGTSLDLVVLPNCSKPILTFNSIGAGSAAYGWTGSEYKIYKAQGFDLHPTEDTNDPVPEWGVYHENGGIGFRAKKGGKVDYFTSCSSAEPDVLKYDHTS